MPTRLVTSLTLLASIGCGSLSALEPADLRPRLIVETDLGGDKDDQGSLIRLLMFADQFDIEAILLDRDNAKYQVDGAAWNPTGATTTLGMGRAYLARWNDLRPNLIKHSAAYPTYQHLYDNLIYAPDSSTAGRDRIIAIVDADDPRPIWYGNWGSNSGTTSNLLRALDHVKATRSQAAYEDFARRLRICTLDSSGRTRQRHESVIKLHIETGYPVMDPIGGNSGRWYHMFEPIHKNAGGFSVSRDLTSGHGTLGAWYPGPKEGDSWTFVYLQSQAIGLGIPTRTTWGGWGGRYATQRTGTDFPNGAFWWNGNRDTWEGSTSRNNTASRFAADIQHHFAARMDWGQASTFAAANHAPKAVVNGDTSGGVVRLFARPGQQVVLSAAGSTDPDGDSLAYRWIRYDEADSYSGAVAISGSTSRDATVTVPTNADGKDIHVYLEVDDQRDSTPQNGRPSLKAYRRVVIQVRNQIKVMCLGDSITDGSHNAAYPGAYRIRLWELMQSAGWNVDLVGSKSNGPSTIDRNHEGWIGYRIDELYGDADGSEPDVDLAAKLDAYSPDVVLLMIGTNDAVQGVDIPGADHRYLRLLQLIQDRRPDSFVVCADLPLITSNATMNARAADINQQLRRVAVASYHIGQWSAWVDAGLGSGDLSDGVHPNAGGYAKIAQAFFQALGSAGISGNGTNPPSNQSPTVTLTSPTGTSFTAPATIALAADAADADGSVAKVEFFAGSTKVGEDSTPPYAFTWTDVAAGTYALTARAIDDDGAATTSAPRSITVTTDGDLVSGLDGRFAQTLLAPGNAVYTDRSYTVGDVLGYDGAVQIRTPNNDKGNATTTYLAFTLSRAATVLVAYDHRATALPAWLSSGFTATGETITSTDTSYRLYRRSYAAGSAVVLGGNAVAPASGWGSNYWAIVQGDDTLPPPPPPAADPVAINFQPATAPTVSGYLVDSGLAYATRDGQTYGWNRSNATTRDRNRTTDQLADTCIHLQKEAGLVWELALPNGTYQVWLLMGDSAYIDQVNHLAVEGTVIADPDGQDHHDEAEITVEVNDGRLTITPASGAVNAKLNALTVTPIPSGNG